MSRYLAITILLAACSPAAPSNGTADAPAGTKPADAQIFNDAPPIVPHTITVAGTASEDAQSGSTPLANVTIGIYKSSDETTPLATATTDATGAYTMTVPTGGGVIDGFIKATLSGYVDNYVYPAVPFAADALMANANLITTSNYSFLGLIGGQASGKGLIIVEILDASSASVVGATVTSTPAATYRYSDSGGTPTSTTGTASDGAAFYFNVPAGQVEISAAKAGITFKSHGLVAHADKFTTTVITP